MPEALEVACLAKGPRRKERKMQDSAKQHRKKNFRLRKENQTKTGGAPLPFRTTGMAQI